MNNKDNQAQNNDIKKVNNKDNDNHNFKTTEVIVLVFLTCLISLTMGIFIHSRFGVATDKYDRLVAANPDLEEFIQTYNDIVENYYGEADKAQIISDAMDGMFSSLDKNSSYLNKDVSGTFNKQLDGKYMGIGIEVINDADGNIVIINVFDDTPAAKAKLKPLDIIKKINNETLKGKKTSDLVALISNSKKDKVKLVISRDGKDQTITVKKDMVVLKSINSKIYTKEDAKIGYINISIFANNTAKQFKDQLVSLETQGIDSLIIDVRNNAGGHLTTVVNILSNLLDKNHVIYQVETKQEIKKFYAKGSETKKYPIVILANENSASASEVLMSALHEQIGSTIIGKTSFGKGTIQELQQLTNGESYKITTKKWLTSKGEWIDEKGIGPDIEITLNEEYYNSPIEDNDNQLQAALQHLIN